MRIARFGKEGKDSAGLLPKHGGCLMSSFVGSAKSKTVNADSVG